MSVESLRLILLCILIGIVASVLEFGASLLAKVRHARYRSIQVVERHGVMAQTDFPYIPGLLSFREAPALLQVCTQLETMPDVIVFDGQGIAHPRGLGIASHLGVLLDVPTIGCAKSRLTGHYEEPPPLRGASTPLYGSQGRSIGAVLRTKDHTKPVFVSVGHKMELAQALDVLLHCHRGYRLPEPTRLADQYVGAMRRTHATAGEKPSP